MPFLQQHRGDRRGRHLAQNIEQTSSLIVRLARKSAHLRSHSPIRSDRFVHLSRAAGVAQAQEILAVQRIEIDAGGRGHAGLLQHARREGEAVVREARHVGVKIERAVGGQKCVEPGARQSVEQDAPVFLDSRAAPSSSSARPSKAASAAICDSVGTEIARFCCSRSTARTSDGGTTIQPIRHPVMQKYLENELTMMASGEKRAALSAAKA